MSRDDEDILESHYRMVVDWLMDNGEKKQNSAKLLNMSVEEFNEGLKLGIQARCMDGKYGEKHLDGRIILPDKTDKNQ